MGDFDPCGRRIGDDPEDLSTYLCGDFVRCPHCKHIADLKSELRHMADMSARSYSSGLNTAANILKDAGQTGEESSPYTKICRLAHLTAPKPIKSG